MNAARRPVDLRCPECRHQPALATALTTRGAYLRCESCGHLWHQDTNALIERRRRRSQQRDTPRRRQTDLK
jgi:uncharacterized Zn finger protein